MREAGALMAAVSLIRQPSMVPVARQAPLPDGVSFLLEISTGDQVALQEAKALTGLSVKDLQNAANFFVEQTLFVDDADSYRILGCRPDAANSELRRNMVLLTKRLHPDATAHDAQDNGFDRSIFINRVLRAWESIKTPQRRASYDRMLAAQANGQASADLSRPQASARTSSALPNGRQWPTDKPVAPPEPAVRPRSPRRLRRRRPALRTPPASGVFGWLLGYLRRR